MKISVVVGLSFLVAACVTRISRTDQSYGTNPMKILYRCPHADGKILYTNMVKIAANDPTCKPFRTYTANKSRDKN